MSRSNSFFKAIGVLKRHLQPQQLKSDAAIALLAVHGSISLNDAIQMALRGERSKYEDHRSTVSDLQTICQQCRIKETQGLNHLKWLLGKKSEISYADRRFAHSDAALDHAERFYQWAYNHFAGVLRVQDQAQ